MKRESGTRTALEGFKYFPHIVGLLMLSFILFVLFSMANVIHSTSNLEKQVDDLEENVRGPVDKAGSNLAR